MILKLMVKHFPQIPCAPFDVPVESIEEAAKVMDLLAKYDLFQLEHNIKPDYSSAQALCQWDEEEQEWVDWCDDDTGIEDPAEYLEWKKENGHV